MEMLFNWRYKWHQTTMIPQYPIYYQVEQISLNMNKNVSPNA